MPEAKRDISIMQADYEALRQYAVSNRDYIIEPLLDRIESIKQSFEKRIKNNKTGLLKEDACKYFDVQLQDGVVIWNSTDEDIICKSIAYDWQVVSRYINENNNQNLSNIDNGLQRYGRPSSKGIYANYELVKRICTNAGLSPVAPQSAPNTKVKDADGKRAERQKAIKELRTPSADGTPKTMPKIKDVVSDPKATASATESGNSGAEELPVPFIGTPFLSNGLQFVLYKPSEAYQKPERQSIVNNYFYADTITMLYGQAGSYKTFLAIWEGLSLVLGNSLFGMDIEPDTEPQKVLYISLEMSAKGIADRLTRMTKDLTEAERQKVEDNFTIISAEDTANMKAGNESFMNALKQLCTSEGYTVIYLDSFADYIAGKDIRSENDMTIVIDGLRTFTLENHVSFRIIHHGTKPTQDANGSMAGIHTIRDLVDHVYLIKATDTKEIMITSDMQKDRSAKSRYGESVTILLQFISDGASFSFKRIQETETTSHIEKVTNLLRLIQDNQGINAGELRSKNGNPKDHTRLLNSLISNGMVIMETGKTPNGQTANLYYTSDHWNEMHKNQ